MGNRAVIVFDSDASTGIYLHWNGGLGSVLAFLEEAKLRGVRSPRTDPTYARARLTQLISEYFTYNGNRALEFETSIGVGSVEKLDCDNGDNGVYHVDGDWKIRSREHCGPSVRTLKALQTREREQYDGILEWFAAWRTNVALTRDAITKAIT